MQKIVLIREVHVSHRIVDVPEDMSDEDVIRAGLDAEEHYLEYSHTMKDSEHTIEIPSQE